MGPGTFYLAHTPTPISAELVLVFSCVAVIAGLIGSELNWVCPNVQSQPFCWAALCLPLVGGVFLLLMDPLLRVQVHCVLT